MKRVVALFFIFQLTYSMLSAQPIVLAQALHEAHDSFRETALAHRRFKHKDVQALIASRLQNPMYEIKNVGKSYEGRDITMLKVGHGPHTALLWTQMHGDEPTATMAVFDILNFLEASNDGFDALRKQLLDSTTLYFVPMLNPDGAERYQRRTAQGIDMNRDALYLQTPEGRILKELQQSLKPEYGFNLHDQSPRYSAGQSGRVATISFLATAYDYERSINPVRERSMKMIVRMNRLLQVMIPGQVARYTDEHEPRAFGDNIQKWGTTLILIESGGYVGDPEKQYIRKLNFVALLSGLSAVADGSIVEEDREDYYTIPENGRYLFDLLVRNVTVKKGGKTYQTDLGINRNEVNYANATQFFQYSKIEEYGDLSTHYGSEELNGEGYVMESGKVYPTLIKSISEAAKLNPISLWQQGYTFLKLASDAPRRTVGVYFTAQPFHILRNGAAPAGAPELGETATFLLKKNGKIRYIVVNGFVYDLEKPFARKGNGIVE
ncbi:M14 family zinc carboxypeptidase [Arundinibacter roseus]|uniref:Peptidase M14 n=1 Tax=Arundinibacter roseus TaxID=2070510 RepID=A0A4R4KL81_9BACT|nr:M14 family zinc carboxypeptidase [Arundinibacter roseus]TDB68998.1 peptidase M14 [Arundinibacter roseus]